LKVLRTTTHCTRLYLRALKSINQPNSHDHTTYHEYRYCQLCTKHSIQARDNGNSKTNQMGQRQSGENAGTPLSTSSSQCRRRGGRIIHQRTISSSGACELSTEKHNNCLSIIFPPSYRLTQSLSSLLQECNSSTHSISINMAMAIYCREQHAIDKVIRARAA